MAIKRTKTSERRGFNRSGPTAVSYDLSRPDSVTISIPPGSLWTSEPHWHETHTEYLEILQGRAYVRLGDGAREYGSQDGVVEVPRFTVHEWHRVAGDASQQDLVVREWTAPADGQKEVFFRALNSFLTEPRPASLFEAPRFLPAWVTGWMENWIVMLQLFVIFRSWDNWPVMVGDDCGLVSWLATHVVLGVCSAIGHVVGLRGLYREYVPDELAVRAGGGKGETKKGT